MPREKATRPIAQVGPEFRASYERLMNEAMMFWQAVDIALKHGAIPDNLKARLQERADAFRDALIGPDEASE